MPDRSGWYRIERAADGIRTVAFYNAALRSWNLPSRVLPSGWRMVEFVCAELCTFEPRDNSFIKQ